MLFKMSQDYLVIHYYLQKFKVLVGSISCERKDSMTTEKPSFDKNHTPFAFAPKLVHRAEDKKEGDRQHHASSMALILLLYNRSPNHIYHKYKPLVFNRHNTEMPTYLVHLMKMLPVMQPTSNIFTFPYSYELHIQHT